ncbi:phosphatidate cytidylyltransferase [bacterium]|nr:phosphatidate cytidylyltransferase [bacterium]
MAQRVFTATALLLLLAAILYAGRFAMWSAAVVIFALIHQEFCNFSSPVLKREALLYSFPNFLLLYLFSNQLPAFMLAIPLLLLAAVICLMTERLKQDETIAEVLMPALIGFCYIGVLGSIFVATTLTPHATQALIWLFAIVTATDTGAYFVGSRIGGPKLALRISPQKTISGALGGLILGTLLGVICGEYLAPVSTFWLLLLLSFAASAAAIVGDLFESAIKRLFGVKDSGAILPGHGGLLDRIDGLLFAAPLVHFISW